MPSRNRKKRSKQRAEYLQKQDDILSKAAISVEDNRAAKRQRYQEDVEENRAVKRQRYQEDVEENRAAKRPKYEDNSAAIKAIGMTPLSDWLNVLPRGSGIAGVTELPLPSKELPPPPTAELPTSSSRSRSTAATCTSPTTGPSIGTSAPTTTLPAATLAAATTTRMAPMARTRPPRP
eukprot:Em0005g448a